MGLQSVADWCLVITPLIGLFSLSFTPLVAATSVRVGSDNVRASSSIHIASPSSVSGGLPSWAGILLGIGASVLMSAGLSITWYVRRHKQKMNISVPPEAYSRNLNMITTTKTANECCSEATPRKSLLYPEEMTCCWCCTQAIYETFATKRAGQDIEDGNKLDEEKMKKKKTEENYCLPPPPPSSPSFLSRSPAEFSEVSPRHTVVALPMPKMQVKSVHIQLEQSAATTALNTLSPTAIEGVTYNPNPSTTSASLSDVSLSGVGGGGHGYLTGLVQRRTLSGLSSPSATGDRFHGEGDQHISGCSGSADPLTPRAAAAGNALPIISPTRTKNKSLIEIRRGTQAALMLELNPPHCAWASRSVGLQRGDSQSVSGPLLLGRAVSNYSSLQSRAGEESHGSIGYNPPPVSPRSSDLSFKTSSQTTCQHQVVQTTEAPLIVVAADFPTPEHMYCQPFLDAVPSKESELALLRNASYPLTPKELEARIIENPSLLSQEFWEIPLNHPKKNDCCVTGVRQKNRYIGVLPNNQSRVVLPEINNDDMSSYINANFIDGFKGSPEPFVATQGPMPHTINDFWRMIWTTRAPIIVMLLNFSELGKKCEMYLPTSKFKANGGINNLTSPVRADTVAGSTSAHRPTPLLLSSNSLPVRADQLDPQVVGENQIQEPGVESEGLSEDDLIARRYAPVGAQRLYGSIHVRIISVTHKEGYTKRILRVKCGSEERNVVHFWYHAWADHALPDGLVTKTVRRVVHLVEEVEACRQQFARSFAPSCLSTSFDLSCTARETCAEGEGEGRTRSTGQRHLFARRQYAEEHSDNYFDMLVTSPSSTADADRLFAPPNQMVSTRRHYEKDEPKFSRKSRGSVPTNCSLEPRVREDNDAVGPVVVHCSAGIGRTGCFICLCIGCQQLRAENSVDVLGIVSRLRLDRGGMVETDMQYAFLHLALCVFNSLRCGTELPQVPSDFFSHFIRFDGR